MQLTCRVVIAVAALLVPASSLVALEELVVVRQLVDDEQRREARQQYLDKLVDSINQSCDLTERELRRLRVASKGAVEYSFEADRNQDQRQRARMQVEWGLVIGEAQLSANDVSAAARHPIWTRTLQRMLTGERLAAAKSLAQQQLAEHQRGDPRARRFINVGFDANGRLRRNDVQLPIRILHELRPAEIVVPARPRQLGR